MNHDIKCWTEFFNPLWENIKTFEYRINDRNYQNGDTVTIHDYDKETNCYKPRLCTGKIGYVLHLSNNWVVFSIIEKINHSVE